jgi:hypothetical protein
VVIVSGRWVLGSHLLLLMVGMEHGALLEDLERKHPLVGIIEPANVLNPKQTGHHVFSKSIEQVALYMPQDSKKCMTNC